VENILLSVLFNSFWIVGLALLLAAFSYHYDRAQRLNRPLRTQLRASSFTLAAWTSTALVGIGLAGTSSRAWESVLWIAFTIYGITYAFGAWRTRQNSSENLQSGGN